MRTQSAQITAILIAVASFVALPGALQAQTYKADDIVKHFQPAVPVAPVRGLTRGLCIGTEAECNPSAPPMKTAAVAAFDLVVQFKYNSDILEPEAKLNLDEFAKALQTPQLNAAKFLVEGHTDAAGNPNYNLGLSQRRAASVVRYLGQKGVDASKLLARGYGQSKPVAADPLSGDNRRVETRLSSE